jgi:hypothetical protein
VEATVAVVSVVTSTVQEPVASAVLLGACDARASVSGFVVRERDELSGEQSPFMTIEVEGAALHRLHTDWTHIEQVEELFELSRLAVEPVKVPHDHGRGGRLVELPKQSLVGRSCPVLVGRDGLVDELDRLRVPELAGERSAVGSLPFDGRVLAGAVRGDP